MWPTDQFVLAQYCRSKAVRTENGMANKRRLSPSGPRQNNRCTRKKIRRQDAREPAKIPFNSRAKWNSKCWAMPLSGLSSALSSGLSSGLSSESSSELSSARCDGGRWSRDGRSSELVVDWSACSAVGSTMRPGQGRVRASKKRGEVGESGGGAETE